MRTFFRPSSEAAAAALRRRSAAALLAAVLAGCAALGGGGEPTYFETLSAWTKGRKIYEELESRLYIYATYKSPAFRRAYVDEYARRFLLDDDLKAVMVQRELEAAERSNEFLVSAFTPDERWNDFDRRDSIWRLYLDDGSARVEPIEIRRLDGGNPLLTELFPYIDPWSVVYLVRFPRYGPAGEGPIPGKGAAALKLIVAGAKGGGELLWTLKEGE
ncbi:MAG TPA: hypothetical protein ENJ37_03515 [Deltaproteobacteria bacterium]|nr:hypothetical protein [Deltaproteobacteria bacterium]